MTRLLLACLVAALIACSDASPYRTTGSEKHLTIALRDKIQPGDSLEQVTIVLGPGVAPSKQDHAKLIAVNSQAVAQGLNLPDGVEDTDQFVGYRGTQRQTIIS